MHRLAAWLARRAVTPNQVSVAGMIFGVAAGCCLAATDAANEESVWTDRVLLLAAAAFVQLRLLCNLIDGMVAVEGGKGTRIGVLYNELPDRVCDVAIFVGAGYAAASEPVLGWLAAVLAVATAYVRAVGKAEGAGNDFCGPMAKPHRMAVVTAACALTACWPAAWGNVLPRRVAFEDGPAASVSFLSMGLLVVAVGSLVTCARRTVRIARRLDRGGTGGA